MAKVKRNIRLLPRVTEPAGFNVNLELDYQDALATVRVIRKLQDQHRDIAEAPENWPMKEVSKAMVLELEVLKTKLTDQMPTMAEAELKKSELQNG